MNNLRKFIAAPFLFLAFICVALAMIMGGATGVEEALDWTEDEEE